MDEEIEDNVNEVKLTNSNYTINTFFSNSEGFNNSSSEIPTSSGRETYVIDGASDESSQVFEVGAKRRVANFRRMKHSRMKSSSRIDASTSNEKISTVALETCTQTSRTIIQLAEVDGPSKQTTLETQTSHLVLTETSSHEYKIEVIGPKTNIANSFKQDFEASKLSQQKDQYTPNMKMQDPPVNFNAMVNPDEALMNVIDDFNDSSNCTTKSCKNNNCPFRSDSSELDDDSCKGLNLFENKLLETQEDECENMDAFESVNDEISKLYGNLPKLYEEEGECDYDNQHSILSPLLEESFHKTSSHKLIPCVQNTFHNIFSLAARDAKKDNIAIDKNTALANQITNVQRTNDKGDDETDKNKQNPNQPPVANNPPDRISLIEIEECQTEYSQNTTLSKNRFTITSDTVQQSKTATISININDLLNFESSVKRCRTDIQLPPSVLSSGNDNLSPSGFNSSSDKDNVLTNQQNSTSRSSKQSLKQEAGDKNPARKSSLQNQKSNLGDNEDDYYSSDEDTVKDLYNHLQQKIKSNQIQSNIGNSNKDAIENKDINQNRDNLQNDINKQEDEGILTKCKKCCIHQNTQENEKHYKHVPSGDAVEATSYDEDSYLEIITSSEPDVGMNKTHPSLEIDLKVQQDFSSQNLFNKENINQQSSQKHSRNKSEKLADITENTVSKKKKENKKDNQSNIYYEASVKSDTKSNTIDAESIDINIKVLPESRKSRKDSLKLPPIDSKDFMSYPSSPRLNLLVTVNATPRKTSMKSGQDDTLSDVRVTSSTSLKEISRSDKPLLLPPIKDAKGSKTRKKAAKIHPELKYRKTSRGNQIEDMISVDEMIKELKRPVQRKSRSLSRGFSPGDSYVESDLGPSLERACDNMVSDILRRLNSINWLEAVDALNELPRQLSKFWDTMPEQRIGDMVRRVTMSIESPRTQVARAACTSLAAILKATNYTKKPEFYEAIACLLLKTGSYNRAVRRAANLALDDVVCAVELPQAVAALAMHGAEHKSPLVRCATSRLLVVCIALASGGADLLKSKPPSVAAARRHALKALTLLLEDKDAETRHFAERLYMMLRQLQNFEAFFLTDVNVDIASRQMKKFDKLLYKESPSQNHR